MTKNLNDTLTEPVRDISSKALKISKESYQIEATCARLIEIFFKIAQREANKAKKHKKP